MATIPFIAYEISGVKEPTYGSGASNKTYVDNISGNLNSKISEAAAGGVLSEAFQELSASTGITPFTSIVKVSGLSAQSVSVLGYTTISGNARDGESAFSWYTESSQKLSEYVTSGNEYSKAYASAQSSKDHTYQAKISSQYLAVNYGWATTSDGSATITHNLSSIPKSHWVHPSGDISFGVASKVDTSNIYAYITAPGSRDIQWWASV